MKNIAQHNVLIFNNTRFGNGDVVSLAIINLSSIILLGIIILSLLGILITVNG